MKNKKPTPARQKSKLSKEAGTMILCFSQRILFDTCDLRVSQCVPKVDSYKVLEFVTVSSYKDVTA